MALVVVTPPASRPLSVATLKDHLRITTGDEDTYLQGLIDAATLNVESFTRRSLITQTLDYKLDRFRPVFCLPKTPVQSITSINYIDSNGDSQLLDSSLYTVDVDSKPARITEAYGTSWPTTRPIVNAVTIRFVAGYADEESIPAPIKQAMMIIIGHLYENRELVTFGNFKVMPVSATYLLNPYRVFQW